MTTYELSPTNGQKSFYGKAICVYDEHSDVLSLVSYNTLILKIDNNQNKIKRCWDSWSTPTGKHIKSFCNLSKKEFFELPYDVWVDRS